MEKPAGFWIRAAASIIDVFIIAIFSFIMIFINTFIVLPLIDAAGTHMSEAQYEFFMLIIGTIPVLAIIFIFAILYYSLLTSSNMQATLGKNSWASSLSISMASVFLFGTASAVSSLTHYLRSYISVLSWRPFPLNWHYMIIFAGQRLSIKINILIDQKNRLPS
ncbi:hypothetical protein NRS6186_21465 [Bacillus subtilis]|jgi:hypothetical protein|nr:uncharacterized protein BSHJ0_04244 [Bacillus subtilis]MCB4338349.1 hypothetical protein [Bacillus subtilis]QHM02741.1 hypothetical protein C7M26_02950 [Bacillus subtilis]CAF1737410.1 hypothetical protein NRS6111_00914 [Bacillus subtilis]CAF1751036.1 hypothetical protein NRS6094_02667 [Bacillus subtilis]